jgi:5-methylcytosine-specific restriction endonuclease McrA
LCYNNWKKGNFMKIHHKKSLVLNADFGPLAITRWQNAIKLIWKHQDNPNAGAEIVDFYGDDYILGVQGKKYPIPAVIRRPTYIRNKKRRIPFSRKNVFIRDQCMCQYCGIQDLTTRKLTYDHVVPREIWKQNGRAGGTPTHWTNIVTCCRSCNHRKANRTLEGSGFVLKRKPKEPFPHQYIIGLGPWHKIPHEWEVYLTPLYKNICQIIKD